jgi:hypothetical protein
LWVAHYLKFEFLSSTIPLGMRLLPEHLPQ